jgi:hypothetical protein
MKQPQALTIILISKVACQTPTEIESGLNILFDIGDTKTQLNLQCLHKCPAFPLDVSIEQQCSFVQALKDNKGKLNACTDTCSPWDRGKEVDTMMELCDKSLNSWTGQCILDCPNIPVQAQGSGRSRRFLTQTIKMARRRTQKETAAEEKEAESSDAKWCNFVMALSCTGGEGSNCDPCLSDCTDSDMNEINAWQDQCEDVADVVDADDDAKESEDIAGSTPKDLAMETLQQYTGGLESAITITGYAMDQLNTLAVRRAFVYAMGQTLQVPEHDIIILTQLQDKVNVMGLGDSKLSSYWDAGSCGMHGNDFQKNWCSAPGSTPAQFNCADSVKVDPGLCPSGHARLAHQYGTGECCLNVAGCDMFYYAQ